MLAYIKGKIVYKGIDNFIIDNNGIGYKISSATSTIQKLEIGQEALIYTYMQVREDYLGLIGYLTEEEMKVFELIIGVSGVGPKVANSILSNLSPSKFSLAVVTNDASVLKGVPGIGLKTAGRIILELKDKLKNEDLIESVSSFENDESYSVEDGASEALKVLQVLGYSAQDAVRMLKGIELKGKETEQIVKEALKNR